MNTANKVRKAGEHWQWFALKEKNSGCKEEENEFKIVNSKKKRGESKREKWEKWESAFDPKRMEIQKHLMNVGLWSPKKPSEKLNKRYILWAEMITETWVNKPKK